LSNGNRQFDQQLNLFFIDIKSLEFWVILAEKAKAFVNTAFYEIKLRGVLR
jgi:hypothetical protein